MKTARECKERPHSAKTGVRHCQQKSQQRKRWGATPRSDWPLRAAGETGEKARDLYRHTAGGTAFGLRVSIDKFCKYNRSVQNRSDNVEIKVRAHQSRIDPAPDFVKNRGT